MVIEMINIWFEFKITMYVSYVNKTKGMLTIGICHKIDIFRLKKKLIQFILNLFYIGINNHDKKLQEV